MVENIEELHLKPQLHMLAQGKPLGQVEVAPQKIRTTQGIAAEVSELAILRAVDAIGLPCSRIDCRNKCVRIKPPNRSQGSSGKVAVAIHAGGELRHRAESWIGCLQVGKRRKTAPTHALGTPAPAP